MTMRYDLAVVGGGIFGLSVARKAAQSGLSVVLIEKDRIGAGASGGVLGALMPHMPARWNDKKAFQFAALTSLEAHVRALEAETGEQTGYRRCGRVMPITSEDRLIHQRLRAEESVKRWNSGETGFVYKLDDANTHATWLAPDLAPYGVVYETLSARVAPQAYLNALAASLSNTFGDKAEIRTGSGFASYDEASGTVRLENGDTLVAEKLVLASGHDTFGQIAALTGEEIGSGEKGQALLIEGSGLEAMPAVYCDGLYVVPHDDHTVAVGSTADRAFEDAAPDAAKAEELADRARAFCPALARRKVIGSWAGIRPRCHKRDPLLGLLPGKKRTYAATGGYKISFGIGHLAAEALVAEIAGTEAAVPLPESFRPDNHFGEKALKADCA
jgi:glycine/D-amino acid oxidase-like deaminating enzyme